MSQQPFNSDIGFSTTGNITLSGNIVGTTADNLGSLQWIGNSSGDGSGYTTLELRPDDTLLGGGQYLIIDPTGGGHIHIRAGGAQDNATGNLFIGGENSYFNLPPGANPPVSIAANSQVWTFGTNGTLTFPNSDAAIVPDLGGTTAFQGAANTGVGMTSSGDAGSVVMSWVDQPEDLANARTASMTLNIAGSANAQIQVTDLGANTINNWTFDSTGNLTIPGSSGGLIKTVANASIGIAAMDNGTNNPAQIMSWNVNAANPNTIISAYQGNALIQTDVNGTAKTWRFDNTGNLTLPGNLVVATAIVASGASPAPTMSGFSSISTTGTASGNITASGNLVANVAVIATGNVSGGNILTSGLISATGNITAGNISTAGTVVIANTGASALSVTGTVFAGVFSQPVGGTALYNSTTNSLILGTGQTTGTITIGSLSQTGTVTVGQSARSQILNLAGGVTGSGNTATVNLGTAGAAGSTTTIAVGPTAGNGTATFNTGTTVTIANTSGTALSVVGNITGGNILTGGLISATGNITGGNISATGTVTATGKIGYASGSTVTQTTNRGTSVTINALAGTIVTVSASMVAGFIDTFGVSNDQVNPNTDIVLVQIVSPNFGMYNVIAQPSAIINGFNNGFFVNIQNISGGPSSNEAITIRFMVMRAPNA